MKKVYHIKFFKIIDGESVYQSEQYCQSQKDLTDVMYPHLKEGYEVSVYQVNICETLYNSVFGVPYKVKRVAL